MDFGLTNVIGITVISYLMGSIVKATKYNNDNLIPIVCGVTGGILGCVAFYIGMPDFPASDPITSVAVGIASGLASTGVHQVYKQKLNKG